MTIAEFMGGLKRVLRTKIERSRQAGKDLSPASDPSGGAGLSGGGDSRRVAAAERYGGPLL